MISRLRHRLRPRYSLRALFLTLTIFAIWLGVQAKWAHDRREFIRKEDCTPFYDESKSAPGMLWLFGEKAAYSVIVYSQDIAVRAEAARLFPEQEVPGWLDEAQDD